MKNWRTTLSGIIAATLQLWAAGGFDGTNPRAWLAAFALAAMGYLAKDAGVVGPEV